MADLKRALSARLLGDGATPASTVSIRVPRPALRGVVPNGLAKADACAALLPLTPTRRVHVEAADAGVAESVFFVPETPNVLERHARAHSAQYVKLCPAGREDVVRKGDAFEISFVGMSVAKMDMVGNNELLLCSLTRDDGIMPKPGAGRPAPVGEGNGDGRPAPQEEVLPSQPDRELLSELPTALTVQPGDTPFLHYDPEVDGHDVGSAPNVFVPIPGSKRVYLQRRGGCERDVFVRFTVMEVDKLSEEQLIAIKSLEDIGKSVGKAAASIPYLKFISWILKFANYLGRSALRKVSQPEHVLSKDIAFMIADRDDDNGSNASSQREEQGNYLRVSLCAFHSVVYVRTLIVSGTHILHTAVVLVLLRSTVTISS